MKKTKYLLVALALALLVVTVGCAPVEKGQKANLKLGVDDALLNRQFNDNIDRYGAPQSCVVDSCGFSTCQLTCAFSTGNSALTISSQGNVPFELIS